MAANGTPTCPTTGVKMKNNENGDGNVEPDLDEDLRRKVETLQIGDRKEQLASGGEGTEAKSYEDWKDELPIHLKSLKFIIGVLNDQHGQKAAGFTAATTTVQETPTGPVFGDPRKQLRNLGILETTWEDSDDRPKEKISQQIKKRSMRVPFHQFPSGLGRRPRMESSRSFPRRRTKSAEPDLSSYRNETPFGTRAYKHRDSDSALNSSSTAWFRKRRSVDLNGVYVVEEISEEDEDLELEHRNRIGSADGSSPDSLSVEMDLNLNLNPESVSSPLKPIHRLRRDLWNISPISEDFSESDKEIESIVEATEDLSISAISSTNATFGDSVSMSSMNVRLNCTSPILSQSPSLRKTPSNTDRDTPPSATPSGSGGSSVSRRTRDFARALEDISDKEEPNNTATSEETDEEKTESFEIDLAVGEALNTSFTSGQEAMGKSALPTLSEILASTGSGEIPKCVENGDDEKADASTTVWETLSANIQAHMGVGNPAGFVEGPIDHPLQISSPHKEHPRCKYSEKETQLDPIPNQPDPKK